MRPSEPRRGRANPPEPTGAARRALAAGAVAIALLSGGAIAVLSRDARPAPAATAATAAPEPAPPPAESPPSDAAPVAAPVTPVGPPAFAPRPPPPAPERVPGVVPRAAPHRLPRGSPAPVELFAGLRALEAEVARCGRPSSPAAGSGAGTGTGRARSLFLLDLETLDRRVRIVEAPVQARGAATDDALACAEGVLLGHEITVQLARPGSRIQLPLSVDL